MRIAIETLGTRGDVQPYIALARGLIARGHQVQIAAPAQFERMVRAHGLAFAALPGAFLDLLDTPEAKAAFAGSRGFGAGFKLLKHVRPLMRELLDAEWTAVRTFEPDLIIHHPKSIATPHMAEALGCPAVLASPVPGLTPTSAFPTPFLPFASLGPLNRASHLVAIRGAHLLFGRQVRDWRETSLRLARRPSRVRPPAATVYAFSPQVVPVPPDWGEDVLVSGYWFLDQPDWQMPDELSAFLEAGASPVYVGFGSMPGLDPQRLAGIVLEALAKTGKRGVLATGGGALEARHPPGNVLVIDEAPHDRLFPRVAACVHHGGAGTTGASLRAGKPTTICPFFGDQPFWGRRVRDLGVGPPALDPRTLSAESLAAAITAMDGAAMRERAAALGARIRREDGVAAAIDFIERLAPRPSLGR